MTSDIYIHSTAEVSPQAAVGAGTKIWQHTQVREGARLGENCILGKGVYIDAGVQIGNNVKVQNGVSIYQGVTLGDGVFCGPHCVFTNDLYPRAVNPDGTLQDATDWEEVATKVLEGASIGANATIVCGTTIGAWSMIGAGSVVTRDVPDHGLVYGNPAKLVGFVCRCGGKLEPGKISDDASAEAQPMKCQKCGAQHPIPRTDYAHL